MEYAHPPTQIRAAEINRAGVEPFDRRGDQPRVGPTADGAGSDAASQPLTRLRPAGAPRRTRRTLRGAYRVLTGFPQAALPGRPPSRLTDYP